MSAINSAIELHKPLAIFGQSPTALVTLDWEGLVEVQVCECMCGGVGGKL